MQLLFFLAKPELLSIQKCILAARREFQGYLQLKTEIINIGKKYVKILMEICFSLSHELE